MRKRGIALVMVLTVASVVVMLTGAFVVANNANFSSLGASQRQREADLTAESAAQFIYFQLENDQTFARQPFTDNDPIDLPGKGMRVNHLSGSSHGRLRGVLLDESDTGREPTFTADIYNNLNQKDAQHPGFLVPADSVLIRIEARSGSFTSRRDVLYRGEPLYDASITANKLVDLASNSSINIYSKDRARNWLRSNGKIHLNSFAKDSAVHTTIHKDASSTPGIIWAKDYIYSGSDQPLQGADLSKAAERSGGVLAPKSRINHDIYKLSADDLSVFKAGDTKDFQSWGVMAPGTYSVENSKVYWNNDTEYAEVKTVTYTPDDGGDKVVWYDRRQLVNAPVNLSLPQGWGVQSTTSNNSGIVGVGGTSDNTSAMTFDFDKNEFLADNSSIVVHGNLRITSKIDGVVPSIKLKSTEYSSGVIRTTDGGSIVVQGTLSGGGALVAEGDVKLMCNQDTLTGAETNVEADKSAGVVLYGGKNVTIFGGSNRNIQFKGLIYSENDVNIWGGAKVVTANGNLAWEPTEDTLDLLELQGAVVAHTGGVNIAQTKDVTLTYDQDYLRKLTKGMPANRRRIAHLWTRAY
ncbi:MAG: hypothetical protein U0931_23475 [Vulcanimicrobiota bacterium]